MGPVLLAGTDSGEVLVFELLGCSFFKAVATGAGIDAGGDVVTALAVHPTLCDVQAAGPDIGFAGHSDGSAVAVNLATGDVIAEFVARDDDFLDVSSGGCVHARVTCDVGCSCVVVAAVVVGLAVALAVAVSMRARIVV